MTLGAVIAIRYHRIMEQALIRKLKPGTLAAYRALASARGSSLEAELRRVIESNVPIAAKDSAALLALSDRLRAGTLEVADSTPSIRRDRDTNAGRLRGRLG